ncbi:hypothetical protein HYU07_02800 [Candidatus Woesearchaeota archaeon]|nr:hypothetical protein [Candidatus Woesearchaeota archaeon]
MPHHIARSEAQQDTCLYCGSSLKDKIWDSEFKGHLHYKTLICSCGRKAHIRMNFKGSGHDSWNNGKVGGVISGNGNKVNKTIEHRMMA